MDEAVAAITRATEQWGEAFRAGDVTAAMAFVTPDAVLVPPNEPALVGREAVEAWSRGLFEAMTVQRVDVAVDGVRVADGWAVSHGRWHMTMAAGDDVISDTTRYVVVWERQEDGSWRVAHDVWNSALPAG